MAVELGDVGVALLGSDCALVELAQHDCLADALASIRRGRYRAEFRDRRKIRLHHINARLIRVLEIEEEVNPVLLYRTTD